LFFLVHPFVPLFKVGLQKYKENKFFVCSVVVQFSCVDEYVNTFQLASLNPKPYYSGRLPYSVFIHSKHVLFFLVHPFVPLFKVGLQKYKENKFFVCSVVVQFSCVDE